VRGINEFLIVFVFAQLISCTGSRNFTGENILIEMEKTPCYGQCPVYSIQIDQMGNGLFKGVENTELVGLYSFHLHDDELIHLKSMFEGIGFFTLEDRYFEYVSDLPTTYITYRSGGKEKKIMDYYGAPKELNNLEKQIETLVLTKKMKKIDQTKTSEKQK
ncbi:MAG: hypothetical protein KAT15_24550, partial [Bacteroidales bacterium]|nr:hypothetical protein [Bacteroidales bacterium]